MITSPHFGGVGFYLAIKFMTAMRLQLHLSQNTEPVPFNHLHQLTGALHKWLGPNNIHDGLSLYSFGWLRGAKCKNGHLTFPEGATWNVSFHDADLAKRLAENCLNDSLAFNMKVNKVDIKQNDLSAKSKSHRFLIDSPVLIRSTREDGTRAYIMWNNPEADLLLTRIMKHKLETAGFTGKHLETVVVFDRSYHNASSKLLEIKGIKHKASVCPIYISGTPEAIAFASCVGAGELTGSGFGALL